MTRRPRPPRLAAALLRRVLPDEIAEALVGDMEEGFRGRVERVGVLRAHAWYWGQVARLPYGALARAVDGLKRARSRRVRDMTRGGGSMGRFREDLRTAARGLLRRPGFALVVVATLATSIGAATLIFSALEAVLARALPYPHADRVVSLYGLNEAWRDGDNAQLRSFWNRYPVALDQLDAARRVPGVVAAGGVGTGEAVVRTSNGAGAGVAARRIPRATVTAGVFEALGVAPLLGRLPSDDELASGAAVAVVSHTFWTEAMGRDPDAVGRAVDIDGRSMTVVGVMPADFWFPTPTQQIWVPLPAGILDQGRSLAVLTGVARVAEGTSIADVSTTLDGLARGLAEQDPDRVTTGMRAVSRREEALGQVKGGLSLFMGAVVLVVLLAAVNLTNLVLVRASSRRGELAVRRVLGGGRAAVGWAVMAEVVLLCVVGGGLGVAGAAALLRPFVAALTSVGVLKGVDVHLDPAVLLFALCTTVLAALGAGVPVAWRASRSHPAAALRDGRRGGVSPAARRVQRGLLVAESGVAFVLLAGAVLLVRSVAAIASVDPGYDVDGVDFVELRVDKDRYDTDEARLDLFRSVAREAATRAGAATALAGQPPASGTFGLEALRTPEQTVASDVLTASVSADYFKVLELPVVRGRAFTAADGPDDAQVVMVDELLAARLAPQGDAVGREVLLGRGDDVRRATIVGVVAKARLMALVVEPQGTLFVPFAQETPEAAFVMVRSGAGRAPAAMREAALAVDPNLVIGRQGTLEGLSWQVMAPIQARAVLLAALAALAVLLAAVGIFGVVAHVVEERTREIGLRIALGALPRGETLRVTRSFLFAVGGGTLLGLAVALPAARVLNSFLYEVRPLDPLSFVAAAVALSAFGTLAAWIPARRAASVDPMEVLNRE